MILGNKPFSNCLFSEEQAVGWGLDEFGMSADTLKLVKMPVVSQDTCAKSDIKFFQYSLMKQLSVQDLEMVCSCLGYSHCNGYMMFSAVM